MKKPEIIILVLLLFLACKKEVAINFTEHSIESTKEAIIALNYPKAEGAETVSNRINATLEAHIMNQINLSETTPKNHNLNEAVSQFDDAYNKFVTDFPDTSQKWEALIDGEVTYRSAEIISIVLSCYLDTGGAHGNTNVKFFNFDPQTGEQLKLGDLISNNEELTILIKKYLNTEIDANVNEPMENVFFGENFKMPESIGYSDDGLIILYNPYEIATYAQGIIEFSIPFEEVDPFLNIR